MPDIPSINQIRQAFRIPDSILILASNNFLPKPSSTRQHVENFNVESVSQADKSLGYTSSLGTPVYTNIEFLPGTYETKTKGVFNSFGSSTDGPDRLRYEAVLITVSQEKKIITTAIQGRDGTVKEYIGLDDYQVVVNGIITGANGQRPMDQIIALKKMLDAPIAVEVASRYLQALDINYLVLKSYELDEQEGGYSYQRFSLTFISDVLQEIQFTA